MLRLCGFTLIILTVLFTCSCKKDVLQWKYVQKLNSNTTSRLNHVRFIGNDVCIASGGIQFLQSDVVRSADGGYTWAAFAHPDAPKEMYGMGVAPNGKIYLSGIDGDILHSSDTGKTWQFNRIENWNVYVGGTFPVPDTGIFVSSVLQRQCTITRVDVAFHIFDEQTYAFGLNNIYMTGPSTGYIIGYGAVMKTTDRGDNWNFQDVKGDNFTAMDIHGDQIWMCGFNGSVYHTWDGGEHWEVFRNGNDISIPRYNMLGIVFKDNRKGWAVCDDGKVIHSDDGGKHWAEYDRFTTDALRSIAICPNGDLIVCGDKGGLYRILPKP
jgi:photosystem II stability/assembly factor-like uncharacterized protein